jgi:hypothetical protein
VCVYEEEGEAVCVYTKRKEKRERLREFHERLGNPTSSLIRKNCHPRVTRYRIVRYRSDWYNNPEKAAFVRGTDQAERVKIDR